MRERAVGVWVVLVEVVVVIVVIVVVVVCSCVVGRFRSRRPLHLGGEELAAETLVIVVARPRQVLRSLCLVDCAASDGKADAVFHFDGVLFGSLSAAASGKKGLLERNCVWRLTS